MAFKGKTVLIIRSADASRELRALLEAQGASVVCFSTIEIADPDSWDACDEAIWKIAQYDSVCFTSRNAVVKFIDRIRLLRPQAANILATLNIFAVGEKTRESLDSCGFQAVASPQHASAAELVKVLQSHRIAGTRILFPKSNIAREDLPLQLREMGAGVDEIMVYRTIQSDPENREQVKKMLVDKKIDVAVFFSPSGILNFSELIEVELLSNIIIAVIGNTTAEAALKIGLKIGIVPDHATSKELAKAIIEYFEH